eukprot:GHVU01208172.1.p2 GENE.GHVU01208172.1~~GHVU01208172.1.p2  ORF type:complete len:175 (-),score=32.62 GHVU01208172.1:46-570(-)
MPTYRPPPPPPPPPPTRTPAAQSVRPARLRLTAPQTLIVAQTPIVPALISFISFISFTHSLTHRWLCGSLVSAALRVGGLRRRHAAAGDGHVEEEEDPRPEREDGGAPGGLPDQAEGEGGETQRGAENGGGGGRRQQMSGSVGNTPTRHLRFPGEAQDVSIVADRWDPVMKMIR